MFLSEKEYQRVLDLLDRKICPHPLLQELTEWSEARYHLKIHDYICDTNPGGQTRLKLVVWDYKQEEKLKEPPYYNYNKETQRAYAEKFGELARKYNMHEAYHDPAAD